VTFILKPKNKDKFDKITILFLSWVESVIIQLKYNLFFKPRA